MNRRSVVATLIAVGLVIAPRAHAEPPLALERTIPLHDVRGRIDHMAVDLGRKRLLVAELGNDTVDAIDLSAGYGRAYSERIPGARFELIPEAGHHPEIEQPEAFAAHVAAFLKTGQGTGAS